MDRDDGIRQQPPAQFQKQTHGLFFIRETEAFSGSVLKKTAEATGVIRTTVARIRLEKSERGRFVIPDGSEEGAILKNVESFDKAAIRYNTILTCEETVADSKYY